MTGRSVSHLVDSEPMLLWPGPRQRSHSHAHTHSRYHSREYTLDLLIGMGTETRYLIGLGDKLWKTGVSINSDVNGSAIGTGEIKKSHIDLLLLYIHIILQILSHQSHQLFLCAIIFKHLSMMHFCYSQFRSRSHGWVSARATWKPF